MKCFRSSWVVVAVLSIAACSRPRPAPADLARADLDQLQGTWRIEFSVWNGVAEPEAARSVTILFQADKFIVVDRDGNRQEETITLLPGQNPKAIDCQSKGGGPAAPGIYSLDGDRFTWCSAGGGNKVRPTSFASTPGSKQSLMVLRRERR